MEDCPWKAHRGQGTAPASPVVLQEMNLPVLLPTLVLFRANPASCRELNKGPMEIDFVRDVKYVLLSLGLELLRAFSHHLNGMWEEAGEEEKDSRLIFSFRI